MNNKPLNARVIIKDYCTDEDVHINVKGDKLEAHGCGFHVLFVKNYDELNEKIFYKVTRLFSDLNGLMVHYADGYRSYYLLSEDYRKNLGDILLKHVSSGESS